MKELKIRLTPGQYEKLVEYLFVGNLVIEGDKISIESLEDYTTIMTNILDGAKEFGKEHLVFSTPAIPDKKFISQKKEQELLKYFEL